MSSTTDVTVLPADQVWVLLIGAVVPLFTYALNKNATWKKLSETVKGIAQVIAAGAVGAVFALIVHQVSGFDHTVQYAFSAIVSGLYAHNYLWKPANVNVKFGARPSPSQTPKLPDETTAAVSNEAAVPGVVSAPSARPVA